MSLNASVPNQIYFWLLETDQNVVFGALLKGLQSGDIMPQEIYQSARIISAEVLHQLALEFQDSSNFEYRKYAYRFFLFAGQKGNNYSLAQCVMLHLYKSCHYGVEYSLPKAKDLMAQALSLCKTKSEKSFFNLPLAYVLRANGQLLEANRAILNYFDFCLRRNAHKFNATDIHNGINFCREALQDICHELFTEGKQSPPTKEAIEKALSQLAIFSHSKIFKNIPSAVAKEMNILRQNILIVEGACYSLLDIPTEVFKRHCALDKTFSEYQTSLVARANTLKNIVAQSLTSSSSATAHISAETITATPSIPKEIRKQAGFNRFWQRASIHFDVVDETSLKQEYQKRLAQMEVLINAKEIEIEVLNEAMDLARSRSDTFLSNLQTHFKKIQQELKTLENERDNLTNDYHQHRPEYRGPYRKASAETCFFNPKRSTKKVQIIPLAHEIIARRYQQKKDPLALTGSVRKFAMAEKAFQDAVETVTGNTFPQLGIPVVSQKKSVTYSPVELYTIGATTAQFMHKTHPNPEKLGDSYSPDRYDASIYKFLSRITNNDPEKEKAIAELFIAYGRTQQSVELVTLQNIYKPASSDDVTEFNRICFLVVAKEQIQWLSAKSLPYRGLAVAQARCLILMSKGLIRFSEVFQNDAKYGVYSKTKPLRNPHKLFQACQDIDELFTRYLQTEYLAEYETVSDQIAASQKECTVVLNREEARENLKTVYGGDSGSDDDADYNSDVEFGGSFLDFRP